MSRELSQTNLVLTSYSSDMQESFYTEKYKVCVSAFLQLTSPKGLTLRVYNKKNCDKRFFQGNMSNKFVVISSGHRGKEKAKVHIVYCFDDLCGLRLRVLLRENHLSLFIMKRTRISGNLI